MKFDSKLAVAFTFRHPNGMSPRKPSKALTEALRLLSNCAEMQQFIANGRAKGRSVTIDVFHAAYDGHPLIISSTLLPKLDSRSETGSTD